MVLSSFVRSIKSCFGGMITSFCFLALLEVVVFGDDTMNLLRLMMIMELNEGGKGYIA